MLEGMNVHVGTMAEVAVARLGNIQRELVMQEAAIQDLNVELQAAYEEIERLRTLIPKDEEVTGDALQPGNGEVRTPKLDPHDVPA